MLIGGALGILGYSLIKFRKKKYWQIEFVRLADICAMYAALSIFIYRIGCFIDGHIIGAYTNLPWGLRYSNGAVTHPVALYMAFSALLIFIILKAFFGREKIAKVWQKV